MIADPDRHLDVVPRRNQGEHICALPSKRQRAARQRNPARNPASEPGGQGNACSGFRALRRICRHSDHHNESGLVAGRVVPTPPPSKNAVRAGRLGLLKGRRVSADLNIHHKLFYAIVS
jgi:hypothetical protein